MSELRDYIHGVLESGDHGPHRIIKFDLAALNEAIDLHAEKIAQHIQAGANKVKEDIEERKKVTVHNYLGNIRFECTVAKPKNLQEVMQVMVQAKKEKQTVRAVGDFHSWSPVCETPGYLVKTDHLVGTSATPTTALRVPTPYLYYDVLCGTTWKQAAVALEKEGRALMNIGGYSGLHVLGATSTGTHGSGLKIPPLAGMIRGVTLVSAKFDPDGLPILYRIEPANGITDPHTHSGSPVLIQDDKIFNAVIVGLCAFGIVYSITIETWPFYYISETRELANWAKAKKLLQQGPDGDILKHHNAEVWLNAYTDHAVITRREKTFTPPKDQALKKSTSSFANLVEQLPALKKVLDSMEFEAESIGDHISRALGLILALLMKHFPLLVPFAINIALDTQGHKETKVGKYYDIYDIGLANYFPVISIEVSYPLSTYTDATDWTLEWFKKEHKQDISKALVGFLSLRFTSGISANLSMSYDPNPATSPGRCYLEIFSLFDFYNSIQGFDDLVAPVQEKSIQGFKGRLHWGQYLTPPFTAIEYQAHDPGYYASISAFKKIAQEFDPDGMMVNEFMNRAIFSVV